MVWVSVTRLRVRSVRFLPGFAWYAMRSNRQARQAEGLVGMDLLTDVIPSKADWTFWTMTAWESREAMLAFMTSGAHKRAMPKLLEWCDEASVAHWEQEDATLGWEEADRRMRAMGRASKVLHPSAAHAELGYREPRLRGRR